MKQVTVTQQVDALTALELDIRIAHSILCVHGGGPQPKIEQAITALHNAAVHCRAVANEYRALEQQTAAHP